MADDLGVRVPVALLLVLLALAAAAGTQLRPRTISAEGSVALPAEGGELRFARGVHPADRAAILRAVDGARPEARALLRAVGGAVTVRVGPTGGTAVGLAEGRGGKWTVTLDLRAVTARYGERGTTRVALHELGHVVDFALLGPSVRRRLDDQVPPGYACRPGEPTGACAPRAERFAETFAKWASGDIGVDLYLGYAVPTPASLGRWGETLTESAPLDD